MAGIPADTPAHPPAHPPPATIGSGSYSSVIRDPDRSVAIKRFKNGLLPNALKEITVMKFLNHPNIAQLNHMIFNPSGDCHLYMKLFDGDLSTTFWLNDAHPIESLVRAMSDITSAIAYMHNCRVIHADIKPKNLLYDVANKRTVLCDFNMVVFNPGASMNSVIQTANYRAPEISLTSSLTRVNFKVDTWGAGCVFFELLTGEKLIPNDICDEDPSLCVCRALGFPTYRTRAERLLALSYISHGYLKPKIAQMVARSRFKERYKWSTVPEKTRAPFVACFIDMLTDCLIPKVSERANSEQLTAHVSKLCRLFRLPNVLIVHADRPFCLDELSAAPIAESYAFIKEDYESPQARNNALTEKKLLANLPHVVVRAVMALEIKYYQKQERAKPIGGSTSLKTLCACIYIISCLFDSDRSCLALFKKYKIELCTDEIVNILTEINYQVI